MQKIEPLVKPWYDALEEGRLIGRKCKECGHIEFPPRYACNECGCMETEWTEISGKAYATAFIPQSPMQNDEALTKQVGNFMWASVTIAEGDVMDGMNTCVVKVGPERLDELNAKLPVPVKPCILQQDGYKMLFWELDE